MNLLKNPIFLAQTGFAFAFIGLVEASLPGNPDAGLSTSVRVSLLTMVLTALPIGCAVMYLGLVWDGELRTRHYLLWSGGAFALSGFDAFVILISPNTAFLLAMCSIVGSNTMVLTAVYFWRKGGGGGGHKVRLRWPKFRFRSAPTPTAAPTE